MAGDDPRADGVTDGTKNNWDRSPDGVRGESRRGTSADYDVWLALDEFGGEPGNPLVPAVRKSTLPHEVLPFAPTELTQASFRAFGIASIIVLAACSALPGTPS